MLWLCAWLLQAYAIEVCRPEHEALATCLIHVGPGPCHPPSRCPWCSRRTDPCTGSTTTAATCTATCSPPATPSFASSSFQLGYKSGPGAVAGSPWQYGIQDRGRQQRTREVRQRRQWLLRKNQELRLQCHGLDSEDVGAGVGDGRRAPSRWPLDPAFQDSHLPQWAPEFPIVSA